MLIKYLSFSKCDKFKRGVADWGGTHCGLIVKLWFWVWHPLDADRLTALIDHLSAVSITSPWPYHLTLLTKALRRWNREVSFIRLLHFVCSKAQLFGLDTHYACFCSWKRKWKVKVDRMRRFLTVFASTKTEISKSMNELWRWEIKRLEAKIIGHSHSTLWIIFR